MRRVLLDRRSRPFTDDLDGAEAMHRGWAKANGSKQLPLQSGIRTVRVIHGSQSLLAYGASPEGNIEYLSMGDDSVASRVLTIDDAMFVTTNRNWCDEWSCGRNQSRGSPSRRAQTPAKVLSSPPIFLRVERPLFRACRGTGGQSTCHEFFTRSSSFGSIG